MTERISEYENFKKPVCEICPADRSGVTCQDCTNGNDPATECAKPFPDTTTKVEDSDSESDSDSDIDMDDVRDHLDFL